MSRARLTAVWPVSFATHASTVAISGGKAFQPSRPKPIHRRAPHRQQRRRPIHGVRLVINLGSGSAPPTRPVGISPTTASQLSRRGCHQPRSASVPPPPSRWSPNCTPGSREVPKSLSSALIPARYIQPFDPKPNSSAAPSKYCKSRVGTPATPAGPPLDAPQSAAAGRVRPREHRDTQHDRRHPNTSEKHGDANHAPNLLRSCAHTIRGRVVHRHPRLTAHHRPGRIKPPAAASPPSRPAADNRPPRWSSSAPVRTSARRRRRC